MAADWFWLALAATFLFATVNVVDKIVLSKHFKNALYTTVLAGFIHLLAALVVFAVAGFQAPSVAFVAIGLVSGIFWAGGNYFYGRALLKEDVSKAAPFLLSIPLFVLVFSTFFLQEVLALPQYAGIALLVTGGAVLSFKRGVRLTPTLGIQFMLLASALYASTDVINKYLLGSADPLTVFAWSSLGVFLGSVILLTRYANGVWASVRKNPRATAVFALSETLAVTGGFLIIAAASLTFVSLAAALPAMQPFFVLALAVLLTLVRPNLLREELQATTLAQKLAGIVAMAAGAFLLAA